MAISANNLRELADWVEAHPEIGLSSNTLHIYCEDTKEEAAKVLTALAPCNKNYSDDIFTITRSFGRRLVPEQVIAGRPTEVIPEHEADIVEWDCEPVLANKVEATDDPARS